MYTNIIFVISIILFQNHLYANDLEKYKPSAMYAQLSIDDLGFEKTVTQSDQNLQKTLETRTEMLQEHQFWGLMALGGMALSVLSGGEGSTPPEHPWFAGATLGLYSVSAYYALAAPDRPLGGKSRGQVEWHKWLAWVHVPGMILAPIAGYMAAQKIEKNEKLTGLAEQHKNIAGITAAAFALSVVTVTFEF